MTTTTQVSPVRPEDVITDLETWCVVTFTSGLCMDYPGVGNCLGQCYGPMTYDEAVALAKDLGHEKAPHVLFMWDRAHAA